MDADYLDQLVQRGLISDDVAARMMTHRAEQPNPVRPIVDAARGYLQSGDFNPVHNPGTEPKDYLRELARNPAIRAKGIEQASNFNFGGVTKAVEKIVGAAFLHQGKIYSGPNHIMALDDARNAGIRGEDVIKRGREGFLT